MKLHKNSRWHYSISSRKDVETERARKGSFFCMRYHHEKPAIYNSLYGSTYICNHPVYDRCTLFEMRGRGIAVIQQRYDNETKHTSWGEIDPWLTDDLYLHPNFKEFFDRRAGEAINGLYPTVTIRQIMWALKMKPIRRERWETCFDRKDI